MTGIVVRNFAQALNTYKTLRDSTAAVPMQHKNALASAFQHGFHHTHQLEKKLNERDSEIETLRERLKFIETTAAL